MYKKVSLKVATFVILAAILTVPSTMLQISQAQLSSSDQSTILNIHNNLRSAVGVQPLTWSSSLASEAQNYANQLVSQGYVCDATRCDNNLPHGASNENLAWGSQGYPISSMVQSWANEKSYYNGQPIPYGNNPAGHYTAMVWQGTYEIGCGFAPSVNIDILVCRYNPPGNLIGEMPYGTPSQAVADEESTFNPDEEAVNDQLSAADSSGGNEDIDSIDESFSEDFADESFSEDFSGDSNEDSDDISNEN